MCSSLLHIVQRLNTNQVLKPHSKTEEVTQLPYMGEFKLGFQGKACHVSTEAGQVDSALRFYYLQLLTGMAAAYDCGKLLGTSCC